MPSSVPFAGLRFFALAGRLVPRKGYFCSEFALLERSINNLFLPIGFLSFLLAPHSCLLILFFWTFSHNISMELELLAAWLRVLWLCKEHICAQRSCKLWEVFVLNSIITCYCVLKVIGQDKMSSRLVEHIGIYLHMTVSFSHFFACNFMFSRRQEWEKPILFCSCCFWITLMVCDFCILSLRREAFQDCKNKETKTNKNKSKKLYRIYILQMSVVVLK